VEEHLVIRRNQGGTDGRNSLRRFANFREPLDLTEEQGRYGEVFPKGSKLRRGRTVDPSHKDRRIYTWIPYRGFVG
jgi:hypothetical protein